jgi:hypothetical protein
MPRTPKTYRYHCPSCTRDVESAKRSGADLTCSCGATLLDGARPAAPPTCAAVEAVVAPKLTTHDDGADTTQPATPAEVLEGMAHGMDPPRPVRLDPEDTLEALVRERRVLARRATMLDAKAREAAEALVAVNAKIMEVLRG